MANKLKIASFNIFSTRKYPESDKLDMNFSAAVIKQYMPDFIGLNEVSSGPAFGEQPKEIAEIVGYDHYAFAPILHLANNREYGNGLMSKYPIKSAEMIEIPDPEVKDEEGYYESRCILKAEIDVLGGITVLVSHFGLVNGEKKNAVETVMKLLGENPKRTILMGDFNMTPDCEILKPLFETLKDTAEGYDEKELLSWPADKGERKIDYIFVSKDFKVEKTYTADEIGSDHKMILTEIEL